MSEELTRRGFVGSAGAALAMGPAVLPALGANDRFNVGFIGAGGRGYYLMERLYKGSGPMVTVTAVCDAYAGRLARAKDRVQTMGGNVPATYKDYRQLLADKSIDVVCISTPDHWHPYITVEACKAGKDVYVEKPVCLSINEGQAMITAARKHNRVVQAGTWQRSGEHFQKACEIVRSGELGKIAFVRTWIYNNMPQTGIGNPPNATPPAGLDWDLWLGPAPKRDFNPNRFGVYPNAYSYFRYFWDYAGGHVTDSGIHMLDIVQMAFGEAMPKAITALGGKYWLKDDTETPDTMQIAFDYSEFLGSWEHRCNNTDGTKARLMGITFHGTRGTLYVDRSLYHVTPEKGSDLQESEMKRVADPHPLHWTNFVDCVRTRKRPNSDIETCVRSSESCIFGNVSYRAKIRLDWNEQTQKVAQPEAQPFLYREYRAPWKLEV